MAAREAKIAEALAARDAKRVAEFDAGNVSSARGG
jgi:hypothetical protein